MSRTKVKNIIYLFLLFVFLYAIHFLINKASSDDVLFSGMSSKYTIMEYVKQRYFYWSGRVFPDIMLYYLLNNLWLWRILNPIFLLVLSFGIVRLFKKNVTFFELLAVLLTIGYFNQNMISSGFFWISGSMNYLWPFALGIIGMIPYADRTFREESVNLRIFFIYLAAGFLASISNEQVTLCMGAFALLTHLYLFMQKRKQDPKLLILTAFILIGAFIELHAPGNRLRYVDEVHHWFPQFDHLSLKDHLYIGVIWLYEKIFHDMKGLILLVSLFILFFGYKQKNNWKNCPYIVFLIQTVIIIASHIYQKGLGILFTFETIRRYNFSFYLLHFYHLNIGFMAALFPYVWWTIYGLLLSYLIIKESPRKYFTALCLLAAFFSLVVMFFSPTIYASASRVLDVSAVLITIIIFYILLRNQLANKKVFLIIYSVIPVINILTFILHWMMHGFIIQW